MTEKGIEPLKPDYDSDVLPIKLFRQKPENRFQIASVYSRG